MSWPNREMYFVLDVETDGPTPGINNMLSFAAVVVDQMDPFDPYKVTPATFTRNLRRLAGCRPDPRTTMWWDEQSPEAFAATRAGLVDPIEAMNDLVSFVKRQTGEGLPCVVKPVAVAAPIAFDLGFINYYLHRFAGESVFGHNGLDIRSYAAGACDLTYLKQGPQPWYRNDLKHPHVALADAEKAAHEFAAMLEWRRHRLLIEKEKV